MNYNYFQQMMAIIAAGAGWVAGEPLVGVNMAGEYSYTKNQTFVDMLHQANEFKTFADPFGAALATVGADGWPVGSFAVVMMEGSAVASNAGTYTIAFEGAAAISNAGTHGTISNVRTSGTFTLADLVWPADGTVMALKFSVTVDVKNLRVIRPGYDWAAPPLFTSGFLSHHAPFKLIRYMDFNHVNTPNGVSPAALTAANRPTPATRRVFGGGNPAIQSGPPMEFSIAFSELTNSDMWINIPYHADATYWTAIATLLRDTTTKNQKIYVELSNEIWNFAFRQYFLCESERNAVVSGGGVSKIKDDGTTNPTVLQARLVAEKTMKLAQAFEAVFGSGAMMTRIRPVFAYQIGGGQAQIENALNFIKVNYGPPSQYFWTISGAPYYNLGNRKDEVFSTADIALDVLQAGLDVAPGIDGSGGVYPAYEYERFMATAARFGLKAPMAYEIGFDTAAATHPTATRPVLSEANASPRITAMVNQAIADWQKAGGGAVAWFTSGSTNSWGSEYGSWALTEGGITNYGNKYNAVAAQAADTTPEAVVGIHQVGATFEGYEITSRRASWTDADRNATETWYRAGDVRVYSITAPADGLIQVILNGNGNANMQLKAEFNGAVLNAGFVMPTTTGDIVIGTVMAKKGINSLLITDAVFASGGNARIQTIRTAAL
ncbi:MAG TPA: hypothetical protein PKV17_15340, partial [Aquabacterium sp.]|nr:hypothetical protein [Aquabacterium sp.]